MPLPIITNIYLGGAGLFLLTISGAMFLNFARYLIVLLMSFQLLVLPTMYKSKVSNFEEKESFEVVVNISKSFLTNTHRSKFFEMHI